MPSPCLKIVLVTPEIPFNTGAIGRTCVALELELILIKPYGFSLDEKTVKRAGTRYWQDVQLREYEDWASFLAAEQPLRDRLYFFEDNGAQTVYDTDYHPDSYLIFGKESTGLPPDILSGMEDRLFRLPMRNPAVKSLNLSNAATAVIYQALRPQG
ncbi:MAG: tRNA (cytidine(34)-2'-O)-methyltransferase [Pelagimonas sp.]|jgi:tRNA (cytidine/uridine-2'-O-)-methyltransferase|nr:tRNA (cytidine(34)-2'-O)-methyltransferase [Pelagimonas sp.]